MSSTSKTVRLYTEKHFENIRTMFSTLYTDELLSDVTLCCRNGTIKAHKVVLAATSPYFRKVFIETGRQNAVFIMHGVDFQQLKNLIELIYKGCIDIPTDEYRLVYDLAENLEVTGVLIDEKSYDDETINSCGRDTRFKGQKRVAVDYDEKDSPKMSKVVPETSCDNDNEPLLTNDKPIANKPNCSTVWAKKLRKFKCELCPSSFKRASHLTRHQLVHTGERPYACDQCDKAFSRHDKLKHHIKKTHEMPTIECNENISTEALYTIGHVRILTPEPDKSKQIEEPPAQEAPPQKKGRGRPRKYPPVPKPLVKRPRGRPRLNPVPDQQTTSENYDITNLPFGDLEYLTKPLNDNNSIEIEEHPVMIEPLVEIKCEPQEKNERNSGTFLDGIGLLESNSVAKIGECTISVANNNST